MGARSFVRTIRTCKATDRPTLSSETLERTMNAHAQNVFLQALHNQLQSLAVPAPGDRWLLAVSGGPDSMAMMHGLAMLRADSLCDLEYMHVAHLDHQLRGPESQADAAFVAEHASLLDLPFTTIAVDIAAAADRAGESIETAARNERLRFLIATAAQHRCNTIVLGHNADDNVETILHRILRGTAIRGLAGIRPVRPAGPDSDAMLLRPMLNIRRSHIQDFLHRHEIPYRTDRSNLSRRHTRNRIRHDLLPQLRDQYNPNLDEALLQLAGTAESLQSILESDAAAALAELTVSEEPRALALCRLSLTARPRIRQAEIFNQAMARLHIGQQRIGHQQITAALELIASGDPGQLQLPSGLLVRCTAETVRLEQTCMGSVNTGLPALTEPVTVTVPGTTELPAGLAWFSQGDSHLFEAGRLQAKLKSGGMDDLATFMKHKNQQIEMLDADKVSGRLVVRCRRSIDRFTPLGATGSKTLGDFFTDAKVPRQVRPNVALLCDDAGVVWVMGMRIAERVKVTPRTRHVLSLKVS